MSFNLEGVARLYRNLFTLPSTSVIIVLLVLAHVLTGSLMFLFYYSGFWLKEIFEGGLWGLTCLLPASLASIPPLAVLVKDDYVWNLRRITGLAFFSIVFWSFPTLLGIALQYRLPTAPLLGASAGLGLMALLRMIVFKGASNLSLARSLMASLIHPLLIGASLITSNMLPLSFKFLAQLVAAWVLFTTAGYLYLYLIDRTVAKELGVSGLRLLHGFMAEWLSGKSQPLEEALSEIGVVEKCKVLVLEFVAEEAPAASIIVPMVHPGPFRNVGGATLPHLLSRLFEEHVGGVAGVAHGASTHAQNPVSRSEAAKLASEVVKFSQSDSFKEGKPVSPLVQVDDGIVKVGCQLYGSLALFTVSLTPCGYDDINPSMLEELSKRLSDEWKGDVFLIDAHSASDGRLELSSLTPGVEVAERVIALAREALGKARSQAASREVKAGGGRVNVKGAGVREGLGSGGVFSLLIEVNGKSSCYVIVDGNNMVPGLRDVIARRVKEAGVHVVEVLTSDSHETNAVSIGERGSNPVGLSVDWEAVAGAVLESLFQAKENMREVEPRYFIKEFELKVVGEDSMLRLSSSVQKAASLAKRATIILFLPFLPLLTLL